MLGMPPLYKRGTDCMNFGFVNFVRRPSVCAQPPGFDNNQPPGKVVRGKRCEYFYHKVHEDGVKWWRFWGHWGISEMFWMCSEVVKLWSCEDVKMWFWNILLYEEILHYAVLRSEWQGYIFYWWLEICFNGRIVFESQRFFYSHYVFKGAKLAKFIRFEAGWKVCLFSITKFTKYRWNDCVFEHTEEHRRCCGKCTSFSVYACRKEHILPVVHLAQINF